MPIRYYLWMTKGKTGNIEYCYIYYVIDLHYVIELLFYTIFGIPL